jgi:hypothetical protein
MRGQEYMREQAKRTLPALCINEAALEWYCLNDTVMGGKSSSRLEATDDGALCFCGSININGGGFASCRTADASLEVQSDTTGVTIVVSGEPSRHKAKFIVAGSYRGSAVPNLGGDGMNGRRRARWESMTLEQQQTALKDINWQCCLPDLKDMEAGKKNELFIPFSNFTPSLYGQRLSGLELDPSTIIRIGLNVGIFDANGKPDPECGAGDFHLALHSIRFE